LGEKWIAKKSRMPGVFGVLEMLNWRFGHVPTPRAGDGGLYRDAAMRAIKGWRKAKTPRVRQARSSPSGDVRRFNGQRKPGNL
jgi:hypothetical protein